MAFGDVDNATHDRRVRDETCRVQENSIGYTERTSEMVTLRRVDQQETWHGRWCSLHSREL